MCDKYPWKGYYHSFTNYQHECVLQVMLHIILSCLCYTLYPPNVLRLLDLATLWLRLSQMHVVWALLQAMWLRWQRRKGQHWASLQPVLAPAAMANPPLNTSICSLVAQSPSLSASQPPLARWGHPISNLLLYRTLPRNNQLPYRTHHSQETPLTQDKHPQWSPTIQNVPLSRTTCHTGSFLSNRLILHQ